MTLTRWAPFQELDSMERRMRRLLEDVGFAPTLAPAADMYETDEELVVELEVPGFEEKELTLEVTDHMLVIKGEQAATKDEKKRSYRFHERLERSFERRFALPQAADTDQLTAEFKKGVLEVHAKKIQTEKPKTVPIKVAK